MAKEVKTNLIVKDKLFNDKPYPVRLGKLRDLLQQDGFENDRSIAYLIRHIITIHYTTIGRIAHELQNEKINDI